MPFLLRHRWLPSLDAPTLWHVVSNPVVNTFWPKATLRVRLWQWQHQQQATVKASKTRRSIPHHDARRRTHADQTFRRLAVEETVQAVEANARAVYGEPVHEPWYSRRRDDRAPHAAIRDTGETLTIEAIAGYQRVQAYTE